MRRSPRRITAAVAALALAAAGVVALAPPASAASGDLLFSEYIEGSSNNKALEIYNPTTAPVDLAAAVLGAAVLQRRARRPVSRSPLTGTIAPDDVFVLASTAVGECRDPRRGRSDHRRQASSTATTRSHSSRAARSSTSSGRSASIPATEWGSGLTSTADNTLRRAADTCVGDADGANAFDPAVGWSGFATDTVRRPRHPRGRLRAGPRRPDPDPDPDPGCGLRPRRRDDRLRAGLRAPHRRSSDRPCASRAPSSATSSGGQPRWLLRAEHLAETGTPLTSDGDLRLRAR